MNQSDKSASHELDLRDLIRVFLKRKFFLIIFTAAALILGIVVSIFVLPKQYVATASITVTPQPLTTSITVLSQTTAATKVDEKLSFNDPFSFVKSPTKAEYLNRIKSTEVLQKVIDSLSLNTTPVALSSAITVSDVPASELINIMVIYPDAETARKIASTLCTVYKQFVTDNRNEQFVQASEFADTKIDAITLAYEDDLEKLDALLLEHDVEAILADTDRMTEELGDLNIQKDVLKTSIASDLDFIQSLEEYMTTQEGVTAEEFELLFKTAAGQSDNKTQIDFSLSEDALSKTVLEYKYIDAQIRVLSNTSELEALEATILGLEDELATSKAEYHRYNVDYERLNKGLSRDKSMLLAYDQRKTEIEVLLGDDRSASIVNVASEATASSQQISPSVIKNALIATVFGLALSGAIVYFKDFWWVNTGEVKPAGGSGK